jgi:hypothetical protein
MMDLVIPQCRPPLGRVPSVCPQRHLCHTPRARGVEYNQLDRDETSTPNLPPPTSLPGLNLGRQRETGEH